MWRMLLGRWAAWRAKGMHRSVAGQASRRWVVVDVESSGLDTARDRLLAIAAIAVHFDEDFRHPRIALGESFEVLIRQTDEQTQRVDKSNILIHGIGVGAQRSGLPPSQALQAWEKFAGDAPLVAFHSAFDQAMINRASRSVLGRVPPNPWLDLEPVAALAHGDPRHRTLDHWLQRYGIQCLMRHQAAADTLAAAQLLLSLWPQVRARVDGRFPSVADWAASHRLMPGRVSPR